MMYCNATLEFEFKKQMQLVTTRRGTKELMQQCVARKQEAVVFDTIESILKPEFLWELQILQDPLLRFSASEDSDIAQCMFTYTVALSGNLSLSSLRYQTPPLCFIGLTLPGDDARNEWLQLTRQ